MGLQTLFRLAALAWYRWALREMDPQHPDLPSVVLRIRELQDATRELPRTVGVAPWPRARAAT